MNLPLPCDLPQPCGRFRASARIKKRREFKDADARGRRVLTRGFVFLVCPREDAPNQPARLGITASRRLGDAPTRNRAKRLVREAFRAVRGQLRPGFDLVVIVRQMRKDTGLAQVLDEWVRAQPRLLQEMARSRTEVTR